jgi:hypothetical protein
MQLLWSPEAEISPESLAQAKLQAALSLGRLDGRLHSLAPDTAAIFACQTLRRMWHAVEQSLASDRAISEPANTRWTWLDLRLATHDPLLELVLERLATLPFTAFAAKTMQMLRSHLDPVGDDQDWRHILSSGADIWRAESDPEPAGDPFERVMRCLVDASEQPLFQQGRPDFLLVQGSPNGPQATRFEGHRAQSWALSLTFLPMLPDFGLATQALPLAGSIPRQCLRQDLHIVDRTHALCAALHRATLLALADLEEAEALAARLHAALQGLRSTSKAPQAWFLIAGLGGLRRGQLAACLGTTLAGMDQALTRLHEAGLIARSPDDPRGAYRVRQTSDYSDGQETDLAFFPAQKPEVYPSIMALEDAMATIGALMPSIQNEPEDDMNDPAD